MPRELRSVGAGRDLAGYGARELATGRLAVKDHFVQRPLSDQPAVRPLFNIPHQPCLEQAAGNLPSSGPILDQLKPL